MTPISPSEYEARIAALQAEIERMRLVVQAAQEAARGNNDYKGIARIRRAVAFYQSSGGKDGADENNKG